MGDYCYTTIWERFSLEDEDWGWYAPTKRDLSIYREGFEKRLPDCLEWTGDELLVACDGHRNLSPEDEETLSKFSVEEALEGAYEDLQKFWDSCSDDKPLNVHNGRIVNGFTNWGMHYTWNKEEQVWELDSNPDRYRTEVPEDAVIDD